MKKLLLIFISVFMLGGSLLAQRTISGTITDDAGEPLIGATILVKGTSVGTVTDIDGKYSLNLPEGNEILIVSYTGYATQEIGVEGRNSIDLTMETDFFGLEEIVVAGVASGTPQKKLTVSVGRISDKDILEVPATSAATALQGKMSGVRVTRTSGTPGQGATITLRGATSLMGSQEPLYIVDGAILEGGLEDINVDDIATIEVVKGAAASALYGSRAGNGVVVITTKRGDNIKTGSTRVVIRNEFGVNSLPKLIDVSEHHHYVLKDANNPGDKYTDYAGLTYPAGYAGGTDSLITGVRVEAKDRYQDNEYAFVNNHQERMFRNGQFYTNYASVAGNTEKTNFMLSFENNTEEGVIALTKGYNRKNFRVNVDHFIGDKIKLSASNMIGKSFSNTPGGQTLSNGGIFFDVLFLLPDVDLERKNEQDGSDYDLDVGNFNGNEDNPLYSLDKLSKESNNTFMVGTYGAEWYAADWITLEAKYAFDRRNNNFTQIQPKGFLERGKSKGTVNKDLGFLYNFNSFSFAQTTQFTANFNKAFGKLSTKTKLSYLFEDLTYSSFDATGYDFNAGGAPVFDVIEGDKFVSSTTKRDVRSRNLFGIVQFDYSGKYLADVMYRYDGSSLFGENERWHPYYRVSAAYRISEDIDIAGIQELKLRASYGTSGQRPGYNAQYEAYNYSNGGITTSTLGNKDLKPSRSKEFEVGLNADFLNRFNVELIYSNTNTDDQIIRVPLAAYYGFDAQWQNAGSLESKVFEATLGVQVMKTNNFSWKSNLIFDKIQQKVTKLNVPAFQIGPIGQEADQVFYIREGETFGIIYGIDFLTNLEDMKAQLGEGETIADYELNSEGYVVPSGSQGTKYEKPVKRIDEKGNDKKVVIGDTNPKFHLGFSNMFAFKGISLYALLDWKNGGDVYNRTKQWMYRDLVHSDVDQYGKDPNEKKTVGYYQALYDVNSVNSHFVEDASYVKLRELSLYYTLGNLESIAGGLINSVKIGLVGRNLFTFSNYSGYDPEVGQVNDSNGDNYAGSSQFFAFDAYGYPNFKTLSGSLTITF